MPTTQTPLLVAFNLFLLVMMFLLMRKATSYPFKVNYLNRRFTIFLSFVFVLFSFWGADWFHYLELYPSIKNGDTGHMESVYVYIAQNLSVNYLTFRFVVWGTGLILIYILFRHLSISCDLLILMFSSIWIIWFSYARVSASMSFAFISLLCLIKPGRSKLISYSLGILFLFLALLFHKTGFFAVICVMLTWLSFKLSPYAFLSFVVLGMIVAIYFSPTVLNNLVDSVDSEEGMWGTAIAYGAEYMSKTTSQIGLGTKVQYLFERLPYYLLVIQCLMCMRPRVYRNIPLDVSAFMRLLVIIVFITSLFAFNMDVNTRTIYDRFLRFAAIPGAVVMAYFWENKFYPKLTRYTFYIALAGAWYAVLYSMYCSMMS